MIARLTDLREVTLEHLENYKHEFTSAISRLARLTRQTRALLEVPATYLPPQYVVASNLATSGSAKYMHPSFCKAASLTKVQCAIYIPHLSRYSRPTQQNKHGVDTQAFGVGRAKSLDNLWQEVLDEETTLAHDDSCAVRHVTVLNVYIINSKQQVLQEEYQILPNGVQRARGVPLSEKMKAGEAWQDAVLRAVKEELGSVLPSEPEVSMDEESHQIVEETSSSHSYPGLTCKYTIHKVEASVPGLPESDRFTTTEQRPDGIMENHWVWTSSGTSI